MLNTDTCDYVIRRELANASVYFICVNALGSSFAK